MQSYACFECFTPGATTLSCKDVQRFSACVSYAAIINHSIFIVMLRALKQFIEDIYIYFFFFFFGGGGSLRDQP